MAVTSIADIQVPEVYAPYILERTAALSEFYQSGIVVRDPAFDALAAQGGTHVDMPFWQDLTGAREILSDSGSLTPAKLTTSGDIARIHNDAKSWAWNILAKYASGADPASALATYIAAYWSRTTQTMLINSLTGVFAAPTMAGTLLAIHSETIAGQSAATKLTGSTFVDATVKLGDRGDRLTAVAMHSATEASLRKLDLIDFLTDSQYQAQIRTFQGRRVIIDDSCPVRAGTTDGYVYTTYLFGPGAIGAGFAPLDTPVESGHGTEAFEYNRDALASNSFVINRRRFILHPRGVKFNSASCAGASPTDAELAVAANWTRVFEAKNVRMVAVTHNI